MRPPLPFDALAPLLGAACLLGTARAQETAVEPPAFREGPAGLEVARGSLLEEALPGLFDPETWPLDVAFDADGVPYVLVHEEARAGRALLRVTDPGGGSRPAVAVRVWEQSPSGARQLVAGPGESFLLMDLVRSAPDRVLAWDPRTLRMEERAMGAGWSSGAIQVGLVDGGVLCITAGEVRRLGPGEPQPATGDLRVLASVGPPARERSGQAGRAERPLEAAALDWSGAVVALDGAAALVDGLTATARSVERRVVRDLARQFEAQSSPIRPRSSPAPLLPAPAAGWPGGDGGSGGGSERTLLVAEPGAARLSRLSLREEGLDLVLASRAVLVRAAEPNAFAPATLRHGPGGALWIVDGAAPRLLRLHPAASSGRLEPLRGAERGELLLALRSGHPERRAMAQRLLLARELVVHPQDRGLALLDAIQRGVAPTAAAALDEVLALRGAPLPQAPPTLDGGPLERLARHQVRLDLHRAEPLAARRLLSRWLDCTPRTRLLLARTLSRHPGATDEERRLALAFQSLPESTTRVVGLFDQALGKAFGPDADPGAVFLHHTAPLGVEYVEALGSLDAVFPRLAHAQVLVLASPTAEYTPLWRTLVEAHLARGGGVVLPGFLNDLDADRPPSPRDDQRAWLRALAAYRERPGMACPTQRVPVRLSSDLPEFEDVPDRLRVLDTPCAPRLRRDAPGEVHVVATCPSDHPVLLARDLAPGRVVTSQLSFGALGQHEDAYGPLLRAMIRWAGATAPPR